MHATRIARARMALPECRHARRPGPPRRPLGAQPRPLRGRGKRTGVPARPIAALHWRESSGNFNTYLHQGAPLGAAGPALAAQHPGPSQLGGRRRACPGPEAKDPRRPGPDRSDHGHRRHGHPSAAPAAQAHARGLPGRMSTPAPTGTRAAVRPRPCLRPPGPRSPAGGGGDALEPSCSAPRRGCCTASWGATAGSPAGLASPAPVSRQEGRMQLGCP